MITETTINAVANITTSLSALGLLIHIFGDPDNPVWDNSVKAWLAKGGLSIVICGASANVLTLSAPPVTEVILNVGISVTFFWLSWWQWELFKEMQEKAAGKKKRAVIRKPKSRTLKPKTYK